MSTFAPSSIPAAISGFLAQITAAVPSGTAVCDGVERSGQGVNAVVVVTGWATTERTPATMGAPFHFTIEEQYSITGYMRCLEGSEDQTQSRLATFALWDAVETAVMTDQTLGGAVRVCWLSQQTGTQGPADGARGNGTQIDFELHCEQRLQ